MLTVKKNNIQHELLKTKTQLLSTDRKKNSHGYGRIYH